MKDLLSPKALLFDMDGVLVDSFDSWWKSLNKALKKEKKQEITKKAFIDQFWGDTLQQNLEKLGLDKNNSKFCNTFYDQFIDEVTLFKETKTTLEKLSNYPKAIITNTPQSCTLKILEKFQIKKYFNVFVTSDKIEKGKPNPDMVFKACTKLNVSPKSVILIGDTENDIKAGRAAGCKTIGINTKADFEIKNIRELLNLIKI